MPREVELSLISILSSPGAAEGVMDEFDKQFGMHVKLQRQSWNTAWAELVQYSIYKNAPDVSEVGSTWIGDLIGMNTLRPFTQAEITAIGGAGAFFPSAWNSGTGNDGRVWAIPWLIDSRLLYYRKDLFEQAGIDGTSAFRSHETLVAALERLQSAGIATPLALPTHKTRMSLHNVASWVWGSGGQFVDASGRHTLFAMPEALAGFRQYYELGRFLSPAARELDDRQSDQMYWEGKAAITLSGPWLLSESLADPQVLANSGVVFPPGVPFIGGSSLVIWESSKSPRDALTLVRFLTSQQTQSQNLSAVGLLPARQDAFTNLSNAANPAAKYIHQEIHRGRSFPVTTLWGLVEERLSGALSIIWQQILSTPEPDLTKLVDRDLGLLARRLDLALDGR